MRYLLFRLLALTLLMSLAVPEGHGQRRSRKGSPARSKKAVVASPPAEAAANPDLTDPEPPVAPIPMEKTLKPKHKKTKKVVIVPAPPPPPGRDPVPPYPKR